MANKIKVAILSQGPLTKREADVLQLLCQGQLRKQIAGNLNRSYGCVSKHVESIAEKLGARSAAEIVAKAVASKIVDITLHLWLVCLLLQTLQPDIDTNLRRPPPRPRAPVTRSHSRHTTPRFRYEA